VRRLLLTCLLPLTRLAAGEWTPNWPDPAQFELGRYVFEQHCQVCHGRYGDGRGEMAATLVPAPRNFRSGVFKHHSTPPGKLPTNEDLRRVVRDGLAGTAMGIFGDRLREPELHAVVEYLKRFSRRWRDPANYAPPVPVPALPAWWREEAARARQAAAGRVLFQIHCAGCHGEHADGRGPAASALRDEWGQPLAPANLRAPTLHAGPEPRDLHRVLLTGIGGTPMVSFAVTLDETQRWAVVAWLWQVRTER
jgi:mono/diheme cytochrome c family protein